MGLGRMEKEKEERDKRKEKNVAIWNLLVSGGGADPGASVKGGEVIYRATWEK